jgi:hypothetical protein
MTDSTDIEVARSRFALPAAVAYDDDTGEPIVEYDHEKHVAIADVPLEDLAGWIESIRDFERQAKDFKALFSREVLRRADAAGGKTTIGTDTVKVSVDGAALAPRWDPPKLMRVLNRLVQVGTLAPEAVEGVVTKEVVWHVDTQRMKALVKLPHVESATNTVKLAGEAKPRYVKAIKWDAS